MVTGEASVEVRQHEGSLRGAVGSVEGMLEEGLLLGPGSSWLNVQAQHIEAVALELHHKPEPTTMKQHLGNDRAGSINEDTVDKHCNPAGRRRKRSRDIVEPAREALEDLRHHGGGAVNFLQPDDISTVHQLAKVLHARLVQVGVPRERWSKTSAIPRGEPDGEGRSTGNCMGTSSTLRRNMIKRGIKTSKGK
jgi:hypothetical protein